ncbi:MAG: carboxypeptidase-like regulatory domain-containing protein [Acidobacteria bacterium]|nr:carboxypeptidase-like regulatory domain-containing protein [Acidobacteriota bacterium]
MHTLSRCTISIAIIFAAGLLAQAQPTKETKENGAIAGRVTTGEGRGAAGIALALMPADWGPERKPVARATTDADGRYRMTNVPAGRYRLQTLAPAFYAPDERGSGFAGGRAVNLTAGEIIENEDLQLERGGAITGRVVDADSKPVIGQHVIVSLAEQPERKGFASYVVNPFGFETDDRGIYRIYGLPGGKYHVSVGQDRDSGIVRIGGFGNKTYTRTFHPGVTDISQAKPIELSAGGETTGVDITMAEAPKRFEARGRVIDADTSQPVAKVKYGFGSLREGANEVGARGWDGSETNDAGEFVLRNLGPGRYAAFAVNEGQSSTYSDAAPFEINDVSVSGLVIKMRRGGSVSGSVILEGTNDPEAAAKLSQLSLRAYVVPAEKTSGVSNPANSQAQLGANGSFTLTGLRPGKVQLFLSGLPPLRNFVIMRIERDGVNIADGIEISAGESIGGVRVHIAYGTSVVRGQIEVRNDGQPASLPAGARLRVFARRLGVPARPTWGDNSVEVDARGRFILDGLAAGDYEATVIGWSAIQTGTPPARLPTVKQSVTVPGSGETLITFVYDLSAKPEER